MIVSEDLSLNQKQQLVVEQILSEALTWKDHAYNVSKQKQKLLYVEEESRVDKSQIIKTIVAGMNLVFCKNKIILMTFTEVAADNISENICHTVLNIDLDKKQKFIVSCYVR